MIHRTHKKILDKCVCKRTSQVIRSREILHPSKFGVKFDKAKSTRELARTSRRYDSVLQPISDVDIHIHCGVHSHGN